MRKAERELISYLSELKGRKIGFSELHLPSVSDARLEVDVDARYSWFAPECIFDDCSDAQAKRFLEIFVANDLCLGWELASQLSKLLSKRGQLVRETIEPLILAAEYRSWGVNLYLSYLAVMKGGAALAGKLLDQMPEDGRDGLFLACYKLQSKKLDRKLMKKFMDWEAEGCWSPCATGELYALEQFIAKWLGLYPFRDLEGLIRLYFSYCDEK